MTTPPLFLLEHKVANEEIQTSSGGDENQGIHFIWLYAVTSKACKNV